MKLGIISGGTRLGGKSQQVARSLATRVKGRGGVEVDLFDLEAMKLPLFSERWYLGPEADSPTHPCRATQARLDACEAFLWVSPEYNGGYSPGLKNFLDTHNPSAFESKAIGVATVSAGMMGGMRASLQLQQLTLAFFGYPCPTVLLVPQVQKKWSDSGELVDAEFQKRVDGFLDEFLWLADAVFAKRKNS